MPVDDDGGCDGDGDGWRGGGGRVGDEDDVTVWYTFSLTYSYSKDPL